MRKKLLLILFIFQSSIMGWSQQEPTFSQFWNALNYYNPATNGLKFKHRITSIGRWQNVGIDGQPVTQLVGYDLRLKKLHGGLGFTYMHDLIGDIRQDKTKFNYSYQIPLKNERIFSMGLGVGVNHLKFDPDSSSLAFNKNGFTADLGFAFKSKKFNISIGATQITQSRIGSYRESINFAFASDYIFGNEDGLQLKSQVFVLGDITTAVCDLNATILWKEKLGVGFTYRSNSDFGFSINWDLFKKFRFGYTYELPYSISGQTSKGTHAGFFGLVFK